MAAQAAPATTPRLLFTRDELTRMRARAGHPKLARFRDAVLARATSTLTAPPLVPSMLLQTLLENAVKHGVSQTRGPGRIEVIVQATSADIAIEVRDNGPGPGSSPTLPREGSGFGLRSVRERLAGHFGERARLSLSREGATTIARIEASLRGAPVDRTELVRRVTEAAGEQADAVLGVRSIATIAELAYTACA